MSVCKSYSANYLQSLERKLQRVQKGAKLLDSLQEKKQDCMRNLLASDGLPATTLEQLLELDTPIESGRLHRHLLPVQAVTVGETLHIVKHDALERQIEKEQQQQQQQEEGQMLVTTAFLVMDIRLQIEINIQTGHVNASDVDESDDDDEHLEAHGAHAMDGESDAYSDDLEEYNSEYTNGDGNSSEGSMAIYDDLASEFDIENDPEDFDDYYDF
ncbi:hypothetical protein ACLKA7_011162 [Drosophila subpalustris]